jgi:hypothetical protein
MKKVLVAEVTEEQQSTLHVMVYGIDGSSDSISSGGRRIVSNELEGRGR